MRPVLRSRFGLLAASVLTLAAATLSNRPLFAETTPAAANRIVAVGGSVTEIVYALGEEKRLAARDTTSVFPEQAKALPDIGYMRALSPEGVLSVDPDLILMLDGSGPPETLDVLQKSGIAIASIPHTFSASGIVDKVRIVGRTLGVDEKAEELANRVKADLAAAELEAGGKTDGIRVLFVLSTTGGRIMASGKGTAADGIVTMAGARNAISDFHGYKQLTDEAILSAAPDVVLMMNGRGQHDTAGSELFSHPAIAQTPAGQKKRLITMEGQYLLGFGPHTADTVRDLAARLSEYRSR